LSVHSLSRHVGFLNRKAHERTKQCIFFQGEGFRIRYKGLLLRMSLVTTCSSIKSWTSMTSIYGSGLFLPTLPCSLLPSKYDMLSSAAATSSHRKVISIYRYSSPPLAYCKPLPSHFHFHYPLPLPPSLLHLVPLPSIYIRPFPTPT